MKNGVPIMLLDPKTAEIQNEGALTLREGYDPWVNRMVMQSLADDQVVIDAGCGDMKLDDPCIIRMDARLTPYVDVVGDLHALPFKAQSIDFISSMAVIEHLRQPFNAADEMYAALKPGGYVYGECNFILAYHGYPHHYFNASIHGLKQIFSRFRQLRLGVAPFQTPSYALENLLLNYLEFFKPESPTQIRSANLIRHILMYPIRHYDSKIKPESWYRFAAGVYFLGVKQTPADDTVIPLPILNVYRRTPELQERFRDPYDLSAPDNLMWWAKTQGYREYPEIAEHFQTLVPFSKYTNANRALDRSKIKNLAPIPDPDQQRIEEPNAQELEEIATREFFKWANHPNQSITPRVPLWKRAWRIYRERGAAVLVKKAVPYLFRKFYAQ